MRLKEDKSNWKASNILRKIPPINDEPRPSYHKRKNTRKWCRGKEDIEHVYKLREQQDSKYWKIYKCKNCGKEKYD